MITEGGGQNFQLVSFLALLFTPKIAILNILTFKKKNIIW